MTGGKRFNILDAGMFIKCYTLNNRAFCANIFNSISLCCTK